MTLAGAPLKEDCIRTREIMSRLDFHLTEQKHAEDALQLLKAGLSLNSSEQFRETYLHLIAEKEDEIHAISKKIRAEIINRKRRNFFYCVLIFIIFLIMK